MIKRDTSIDEAARAGWLYYVAGKTQDQIATQLGVSRQRAQRLVSRAVSEGLVKVRIDHPIGECMELARQLAARYDLRYAEVAPTDLDAPNSLVGLATQAAAAMEYWLRKPEPLTIAVGTGRSLKAMIEQLSPIQCPQHKLVSLTGNVRPDGAAAVYNVIFTLNDILSVNAYPMPLPVIASSAEERQMLLAQKTVAHTMKLAAQSDVAFVGVGELDERAPLMVEGMVTADELSDLRAQGIVGEMLGWVFDRDGRLVENALNARVASSPIPDRETCLVIGVANGERKLGAIRAALVGRLVNGMMTDESTARALLQDDVSSPNEP
ncbi:sugar-binding transcriptional regulator [Notoacmeibacter ruber]|uniref:Sugar-binding transcriptional regulator n=1 Tax=Notoacmeibacter ruber TaxID=2670375 RepID=A0A3L7JCI7_9HYPH|nr:sugar-binding transcriptional regulator [Notoacmeibacter ruber]RLQ88025.1 sugar-binding transcriptional regulator [Notoacmeibacter ruber]